MRLYVLGAGTPTPTPDRYGSAYVVELATGGTSRPVLIGK